MTKDLENKIIDEYIQEHLSIYKIGKIHNLHPSTIWNALKRNSIKLRSNSENSALPVNHTYFDNIDTEEKAYWLGFLFADGYITNDYVGLALSDKDKNHLVKFKESTNSSHKISTHKGNHFGEGKLYCRIIFKSSIMTKSLKSYGVVENKSLILKFPNCIRKDLLRHFIRGYFDGDGSITVSKKDYNFKICGTMEFLKEVIKSLNNNVDAKFKDVLYKRRDDDTNNYYISFGGRIKTLKFLDWIYKDSSIYLDRKYQKYLLLKQVSTTRKSG